MSITRRPISSVCAGVRRRSGPSITSMASPCTADQARYSAPSRRSGGSAPAATMRSSAAPSSSNGLRPLPPALVGAFGTSTGTAKAVRNRPVSRLRETQIAGTDRPQAGARHRGGRQAGRAQRREFGFHCRGHLGQGRGAHRLQQSLAAREVTVGGIGHHACPAGGFAQHHGVGATGARQFDARLEQGAAQVTVAVSAARRRRTTGDRTVHGRVMWTLSIIPAILLWTVYTNLLFGYVAPSDPATDIASVQGAKRMATQIFVNLPVKDLDKLGRVLHRARLHVQPAVHRRERHLHDRVGDDIYVMLLAEAYFKTFTPKAICDATQEHRGAGVPVVRERARGRRPGAQGRGGRRHDADASRRITASCTSTASRTWTATSGSWSTWTRTPSPANPERKTHAQPRPTNHPLPLVRQAGRGGREVLHRHLQELEDHRRSRATARPARRSTASSRAR